MDRLCQVCGRRVQAPFLGIDVERQKAQVSANKFLPVLSEPFVCPEHAIYSLDTCPGIKRMREAGTLKCYIATAYERLINMLAPHPNPPESDYPALDAALCSFGRPAVGYVKLMLTNYMEVPEVELREVAKRRMLQ